MAFIGFRIPAEVAVLLEGVEVPGDKHSASNLHITVLYLGEGVPIPVVAQAMVALCDVCSRTTPISVSLEEIASFPGDGKSVPVICPVDSPGLHAFNAELRAACDALQVPYSKKWPEYKPHVTLSYVNDGSVKEVVGSLPGPVDFTLFEATIWGGDWGAGTVRVEVPLVLSPLQRMAARLAAHRV